MIGVEGSGARVFFRAGVWGEPLGAMDGRTFDRLLEGVAALSPRPEVFFGGYGEPLCHPRIVDMIGRRDLWPDPEYVALHRLQQLRDGRGQRGGLLRQPAPGLRRVPVGPGVHPLPVKSRAGGGG